MTKHLNKLLLLVIVGIYLSACSLLQPNEDRTFPVIQRPTIEATECMDGYVCMTEEDATEFFRYVYTLEEAYEKAR